jgi:hypothetical protein
MKMTSLIYFETVENLVTMDELMRVAIVSFFCVTVEVISESSIYEECPCLIFGIFELHVRRNKGGMSCVLHFPPLESCL